MASRLKLHGELKGVLGLNNVYYDPPAKMKYPAIKYFLDKSTNLTADNKLYHKFNRYTVTVITEDPDSDLPDKLLNHFSNISFDRHYTADGLHHFVLSLYF